MQITTLLGSARKKGNTATILGWVEKELETLGHTLERIYLNNKTIVVVAWDAQNAVKRQMRSPVSRKTTPSISWNA